LEVSDASKSAIEAIKKAGGSVTCIFRTKLKLQEHLKPERFPVKLREPLPDAKDVRNLEKIRERGAEVKYTMPNWVKDLKEEDKKAENELKKDEFNIPFPRYPGVGKDKLKKRKPIIVGKYDFGIK